jgi:hypothetical protein
LSNALISSAATILTILITTAKLGASVQSVLDQLKDLRRAYSELTAAHYDLSSRIQRLETIVLGPGLAVAASNAHSADTIPDEVKGV